MVTCRVIDESEMIRVLVDESFDEINLLQRDLDGIFMLRTTGSVGHPQLQNKIEKSAKHTGTKYHLRSNNSALGLLFFVICQLIIYVWYKISC